MSSYIVTFFMYGVIILALILVLAAIIWPFVWFLISIQEHLIKKRFLKQFKKEEKPNDKPKRSWWRRRSKETNPESDRVTGQVGLNQPTRVSLPTYPNFELHSPANLRSK